MRAASFFLLAGFLLVTSGAARADYTGVPIDGVEGDYLDNFNSSLAFDRAGPGSFFHDFGNGYLRTAVFTDNTLTVTANFGAGFEMGFFALDPPPPAFSELTLLSSDFSPTLSYALNHGLIVLEWPGNNTQGQTMTAVFQYSPAVANPVPEPSSLVLLGIGCLYGVSLMLRKHSQRSQTTPLGLV